MGDLSTVARYKTYAGITGTSKDTLLAAILTRASAGIERYLRRTLTATTYKSWYNGLGTLNLRLDQYPILAIYRVSPSSSTVGTVENLSSTVSFASVSFFWYKPCAD